MPIRLRRPLAALPLLLLACADRDEAPRGAPGDVGGTLVVAAGEPDALFPPLVASLSGKVATDLLYDHLAEIGPALNTVGDAGFTPRLAAGWTWAPDSLSIAFRLDPRARWHDGRPVRAEDVRFTHWAYTNPEVPSPQAESVRNVDSVTVRDSATAVFWFARRSPEQFFQAVYHMAVVPAHPFAGLKPTEWATADAARRPVGSGRFRFAKWVAGTSVELVADTANYRGRPKLDRVVMSVVTDAATAPTRLLTGAADFFERLSPETIAELARHPEVRPAPYPALGYGFMHLNLLDGARPRPHPVFGDRAVRRALTQALDRTSMLRNVWGITAEPGIGPFTRASNPGDSTLPQIAYDPAAAARALDSIGWRDTDGDGVREKGGRRLEFTLMAMATSAPRMKYAAIIQEQLRRAGVKVAVEQLDPAAFHERLASGAFDAAVNYYVVDPSPSTVGQMWGAAAVRARKGMNFGSYTNAAFDSAVDSAATAFDPARARAHYRRAYETIVADAPAVWLYESRPVAGVHRRVRVVGMRADAWWAGLADWSIPASERIDRDRIGLRTAAR